MEFKTLLVLACVVACASAVPTIRENLCARECESREDEGMFRAFKSYYFDYEVTIDSRIDGGVSDQTSRVRIQATAAIEGLAACEMVLKLSEVRISEMRQDGTMVAAATASSFSESLEAHPLRFSMESNGTITSVCPEAGEEIWALNAKRGFLSVIQTKRTRQNEVLGQAGIFETDVTGTCMPMYQSEGEAITKTQDYLMCKNRTNLNMFVDAIPVHLLAPTVTPMKSHLECRYEMDAQGLTSVACTEEHTLKPFAQSDSQPITSVATSVTRRSVTHRIMTSLSSEFDRQTTLLYEDPQLHDRVNSRAVVRTLSAICDSVADGIGSETPGQFETLTGQFGRLDTNNMNTVITRLFRMCPDATPSTKKDVINMVKDALIDCDTEQCVQGFNTIVQTEDSAENTLYLRKWFMKLVFHKNPTKTMISIVHRHVSGSADVNVPAFYALSTMIHQYCLVSEGDCARDRDILAAAAVFEENLHDGCVPESPEDVKQMLMSLKAIGNMGVIKSRSLLNRCLRDRNPSKVRIASIEAFRRVPCDSVPTERFMRIFGSVAEDSELRIAAYRAMIRCSSDLLLAGIATIMDQEPTHQVSCYVSSHLSNLRDTQNPLLRDLQQMVAASPLANVTQCSMDVRKFSRNFAFSRYDEESGNGINVDGDVIFSSKSYLPRNVRLGMDVDLFGYQLDLFEIDARMEGLQELFESTFGADEEDRESNMLERVNRMLNKRVNRQKREGVKTASINKIKAKYLQNNIIPEDSEEGALSMKIMDSEVFYKDQADFQELAGKFSRENIMMMIAAVMQQRSHEYTLNKNFKPSRATIPTIAGMPLEVNIQGAMTTSVKASGKFDVLGLATKPRTMSMTGYVEPSAAVEIHSHMMVDAHCARSGLTHRTNMASSLAMGGSITLDQGMLKVKVDAPERRQTVINASSSLFFMQNDELVPVTEPEGGITTVDETFTNPQYSLHISGSRPNTAVSRPESLFHSWGMAIYFDKVDSTLMTYDLEAGFRTDKLFVNGAIQKTDRIHLLVGAPGSETIGVYSADLTHHRSNMTLSVHTVTPYSDTYVTASLRNETYYKNLRLQATHNGRDYLFQAGLDTIPLADGGMKYVPVFNLTIADLESYALEGNVTRMASSREFDLSLVNGNRNTLIGLKGDFINNDTLHRVSFSPTLGPLTASLQAGCQIEKTPDAVSITPIFAVATSLPAALSLKLGGAPIMVTNTSLSMKELFLTTPTLRLVEMSNLHLDNSGPIVFGFEGKIKENIPYGVGFEKRSTQAENAITHGADLSVTSIFGVYHIHIGMTNQSADHLYILNVTTDVNSTNYFSLTSEFKNEVGALQYLDTSVAFRGNEIFRSKNGLKQRQFNTKTRYAPIVQLEVPSLGNLKLKGSCDVAEDSISVRDMALAGAEDLITLSGDASLDRELRLVDWSFTVGGAYMTNTLIGSASHYENSVTFNNVMQCDDGSPDPRTYSLAVGLSNSTAEGQIFAWDAKVELDVSHHQELSFRFDSDYNVSPGRSHGDIFRLCYDGVDCTSTDKRITLGHEITYSLDLESGVYDHDLQATFTHPAQDKDYTLSFITGCYRNVAYNSQIFVQDHDDVIFDTEYIYTPEIAPRNGSIIIEFEIPGVYFYESRDTYRFSNPYDVLWVSEFQSGENRMSFDFVFTVETEGQNGAPPLTTNTIMKYTDIRSNEYLLQQTYRMDSPGNTLRKVTIAENGALKISLYEESVLVATEERVYSRTSQVARTTFVPVQDFSFNTTVDVDLANGNNADLQMQLRFMPDMKPVTLTANFNNETTATKKAGEVTTTLSLPTVAITVVSSGQMENGVPSGNINVKFLPLMGTSRSFGVDLAVRNGSDEETHRYETSVTLSAPDHQASLRHTLECNKAFAIFLSSNLTGAWNGEEVTVGLTSSVTEEELHEIGVRLALPEHVYVFTNVQDFVGLSKMFSIKKDSALVLRQGYEIDVQRSEQGATYTYNGWYQLVDNAYHVQLTLANLTTSYSGNVQIHQNYFEPLYADVTLDLHRGGRHFDVVSEFRSGYAPGYDTKVGLSFERTESDVDVTTSIQIDDDEVFSFTFINGTSSEDPNARVTRLIFRQPTNPDLRLRKVVIQDSCSMAAGQAIHNTTLMWGNLLPTQTVGFRFSGARGESTTSGAVRLLNPGRVMGFGTHFAASFDGTSQGPNRNGMLSLSGESGNIFTMVTDFKNSSRDYTKDFLIKVTLTRADQQPVVILTTLVHNSSDTVLDADLTLTYNQDRDQKLTTGVEVTRISNGHSIILNLQHLVNGMDMTFMGSYSNTSSEFEMTLENSVMIGDETFQPEISFSLSRDTNEVDFTYTDSATYGFHGQFTNLSTDAGRIYQINCRHNYDGRHVPYVILFDQVDRMVGFRVQYNPDNADDTWEFNTGFFNDTAIYAQLDTTHSGQRTRNGSVVLSLTSEPKVVTTHLQWEPSWPEDLKAAVLNIVEKTKEKAAQHKLAVNNRWTTIAEKVSETKNKFVMANIAVVTNALMLKTQVETHWTLSQPIWQAQRDNIETRWTQFMDTYEAYSSVGGPTMAESSESYYASFDDICAYFGAGFPEYAEDVKASWALFLEAGSAVPEQFDPEAVDAYLTAVEEAKAAFWESLFTQLDQDMMAMEPDYELIGEHFRGISDDLRSVGARVQQEFERRISALEMEKTLLLETMKEIRRDGKGMRVMFVEAAAGWREAAQAELEPFRHPDFSKFVAIGDDLKESVETVLAQLKMQMMMVAGPFIAPYIALMTRERRAAPESVSLRPSNTMDIAAIKAAMASFNAKYSIPTIDTANVAMPQSPVSMEVETMEVSSDGMTTLDVLKKIFNGTYEVIKFDLQNGEIMFKVFIKDFSNYTSSPFNATQLLEKLLPDSVDISAIRRIFALFENETLIGEYQRRFQEQFSANRTRYEEIARDLVADLKTHVQETIATRVRPYVQAQVRPYLERVSEEISSRSRPFFASGLALPETPERGSFLEELAGDFDVEGMQRMAGRVKQAACGAYNKMTSVVAAARMAACPRRWLPPYRANALVIGANHYMTFDQQFYDFSDKCGYVLAKDFVHENDFTAIVDYEREMEVPIKNMMFIINSTTFEIKSDGSVLVDRQPRELPLQVGSTAVVRIGDAIFLKNAHGVSYVCKLPHDVCIMILGGRYFARTGGLLGNFNFEPFDDFKTPDNEIQTNITSFTESWKVGKNCDGTMVNDRNRVLPSQSNVVNFDPLHADNQRCAGMFLDNCSPLAQCHGEVDPDAFYRMCVMDTRGLSGDEASAKMCSMAIAYKSQCWNQGHPVGMPDSCITCEFGDETFDAETPRTIENEEAPRKVDVVIVVEEKQCVESIAPRLDDIVTRLAGELKENGFNDTQFGLAAFGGAGVHDAAHQHTINHRIFNNRSNEFVLGRDSLEFAATAEEGGSNDTFAAVRLAANYPFRTGVSKHIILLSCSECRKNDTDMKFSDLSVMLNKRGISLTMLTDFQFSLKKEMSKAKARSSQIYGIDAMSVYTSKMAGQESFKGDRTLRGFVSEPSDDLCALLAQETNGALFDSSQLGSKGFNEVFVKRVVKNSEPAPCQVCRCVPDQLVGVGRSVCEVCVDPANPLQHLIRGGIRDFELTYNLPHTRFGDQVLEEEEE